MNIKFIKLTKSKDNKYKYIITLLVDNKQMNIKFGAHGYSDYTIHKDKEKKQRYINRHKELEDWNNPLSRGSLSRYILWNKETIKDSLMDYLKRFNIKM